VRFWDSSALVTLVLDQPRTAQARQLHAQDPELMVWWASSIECASAIARLHRDGQLSDTEDSRARGLLTALRASWFEVQAGNAVREQALRILRLHPLRAADALQLAAALEWSGSPPAGQFVSFDQRLNSAAQREGFITL
jgi:predicted nucleic acid-binding protein